MRPRMNGRTYLPTVISETSLCLWKAESSNDITPSGALLLFCASVAEAPARQLVQHDDVISARRWLEDRGFAGLLVVLTCVVVLRRDRASDRSQRV